MLALFLVACAHHTAPAPQLRPPHHPPPVVAVIPPAPRVVIADSLTLGLPLEALPREGSGDFVFAADRAPLVGSTDPRAYSVGVEAGLGYDVAALAAFVDGVLADPRSWSGQGQGFYRVPRGGIKIVLATPETVDWACAPLDTEGEVSCARNGYIAINLLRWEHAVPHWDAGLEEYRRYVINHEMGHYLGQRHDNTCAAPGAPAPVMMQQTYDLHGCAGNAWPSPGQ